MSSPNVEPIHEPSPRPKPKYSFVSLCLWTGIVSFVVFVFYHLLPEVRSARPAAERSRCKNNLKQIGLALHNYHDTYGTLPPAFITDGNGRAMHSWRVLLLPFLDQRALYDQYHFDEPWDGPNNRKLLRTVVPIYQCPEQTHSIDTRFATDYLAIVGPNAPWRSDRALNFSDFTDGLANTLLVAEVVNSGIHWMEPRDFSTIHMARTINPVAGQGIASKHLGGAQVLLGDGAVRFLSRDLSKFVLDALITPNGGEGPQEF